MSTKTMAWGLVVSGMALGTLGAGPARAQSALAQQAADQEQAAQQAKTSSAKSGTAKPAAAKPAANATTATKASAPNATATKASAPNAAVTKASSTSPAATKPAAMAKAGTSVAKPTTAKPVAKKVPPKPVVYLDDAPKGGANDGTAVASGGDSKSGKSQNRDMAKAFEQSCPDVTVTDQRAKAGYDVTLEREPGSKGVKTVFGLTNVVHKTNRIEVTGKGGKEVFSESGHSTNQLVKDACAAMATPPVKVAKN